MFGSPKGGQTIRTTRRSAAAIPHDGITQRSLNPGLVRGRHGRQKYPNTLVPAGLEALEKLGTWVIATATKVVEGRGLFHYPGEPTGVGGSAPASLFEDAVLIYSPIEDRAGKLSPESWKWKNKRTVVVAMKDVSV